MLTCHWRNPITGDYRSSNPQITKVANIEHDLVVVGIYGCTGAGKSTLCQALVGSDDSAEVVELDAFRWNEDEYQERGVPPLDLSTLPWPSGVQPLAINKCFDTNIPEWVDWIAALAAVNEAISRARKKGLKYLFIEGFLIATQPRIMAKLDRFIYLEVKPEDSLILMKRKYTRSHFNKKSYEEKGVPKQDFKCFWDSYVFRRYQEHIPDPLPQNTIIVDCLLPTLEAVTLIRSQLGTAPRGKRYLVSKPQFAESQSTYPF